MKAQETSFRTLVQGEKQFQVPLYQRPYSWTKKEVGRLWGDILELADHDESGSGVLQHFVGSVVLAPSPLTSPSSLQAWLVVDGQQRLTTLMLALCALRDHHANIGDAEQAERINDLYLINKWKKGEARYRLLPTTADRAEFLACVDAGVRAGASGNIGDSYGFFRSKIETFDNPDDPTDLVRVERAICELLSIVEITADSEDNVYRIFESLNNTGLSLSQADLLRNYVFMLLPSNGEEVYRKTWLPMQEMLGPERLQDLIYVDLVIDGQRRVRKTDLYGEQRVRLQGRTAGEQSVVDFVEHLSRRASLFLHIIDPAVESDVRVRASLRWLDRWQAEVTHPVVLRGLELREQGVISGDDLANALRYVESFLVRRMLVGKATQGLNRMFAEMLGQMQSELPFADSIHLFLSGPRRHWPTDEAVRVSIASSNFYWGGRSTQRTYVLERLLASFEGKEAVDFDSTRFTIEHVLPQSAHHREWSEALAVDCEGVETVEEVHAQVVHTVGNLTLTAYNSEMSNDPFSSKRKVLADSALAANRAIAVCERWGRAEIIKRSALLADRAIALWPAPIDGLSESPIGKNWTQLHLLLAAMPPGFWTSYTDVAQVIGSHPAPIGNHLSTVPVLNAHRVLTANGTVAPNFRSLDSTDTGSPISVLESEGIVFGKGGMALDSQRLRPSALAALIGLNDIDQEDSST
jgi:alkylated DNA nucleotide flippase Atl1